ncbi:adenosine kinase [Marinimicrobium sp. C2-29]|uniref:adenosine kinase n=1 Tax=Marinimicrobium sp. C2-29 TaxID=3139825 RepID=UPI003139E194
MNDHYHIYGIGAALVDTEIEVNDEDLKAMAVAKGVMTLVDETRQAELIDYLQDHLVHSSRASGGSGANTVIAASYFGCRSFYSCKVADDENGRFYLNDIKAAGVDYPEHVTPPEGITGKCLVMVTPDAERSMNTYLGISATLSVNELDTAAVEAADYAYIEGYLVSSDTGRAAAIELRERAEKRNTLTALSLSDPAMVQFFRDGLLEMIGEGVDLLFCNKEEAMGFTGTSDLESAAQSLQDYCRSFAITCGADGALVFDGKHSYRIDAHAVKAIDSNGAGDMFAGAFLYALSQGHGYDTAGRFASLAAGKVVTQYGPRLRPEQHQQLKQEFFG